MANQEGQQVDTLPVQMYGWDYVNNVSRPIVVNADGEIEAVSG
jgi:hypothetical protein